MENDGPSRRHCPWHCSIFVKSLMALIQFGASRSDVATAKALAWRIGKMTIPNDDGQVKGVVCRNVGSTRSAKEGSVTAMQWCDKTCCRKVSLLLFLATCAVAQAAFVLQWFLFYWLCLFVSFIVSFLRIFDDLPASNLPTYSINYNFLTLS